MTHDSLQRYLHQHIPLSKAMGVTVVEANEERVTLAAPLAPNINHRETVFGGSASAVAILAAWALIHLRLTREAVSCRIVIQHSATNYERPIPGDFQATAVRGDAADWARFRKMLHRRGRARIRLRSTLYCDDLKVGDMEGDFVALAAASP